MSNATDYSFESGRAPSLVSPVSSTGSLKSLGDRAASASSSPETLQLAPPVAYHLAPPVPGYAAPGSAQTYSTPHAHYAHPSTSSALPPSSLPASQQPSFPGTSRTASDPTCPKSLLSRRQKAAPMSIALPPQPAMIPSPTVSRGASPVNPSSAPLNVPQTWGGPPPMHHHAQHPQHPQQLDYATQYAPQDDLAGAMQSVLTPSTLSKLPNAPVSSYDFPAMTDAYAPYGGGGGGGNGGGAPTPALGYGGGMHGLSGPYEHAAHNVAGAALPPTPLRSLSVSELYPPSAYAQHAPPPHGMSSHGGVEYDASAPVAWSTSFHLPSPGVTFTSSTPHWLAHGGGVAATQYFQV